MLNSASDALLGWQDKGRYIEEANNPKTTFDRFVSLSVHKISRVRRAVAASSYTPVKVLEAMLTDSDESVRIFAARGVSRNRSRQ